VVVPSMMIGYPFLAAMGHPEYANKSVIYGSLIHIIELIVLITFNLISIYGVTLIVFFTEIFILLYRLYCIRRLL